MKKNKYSFKIDKFFNDGLNAHQNNQLEIAHKKYLEVLNLNSNHIHALHLLGVIALQLGDIEKSIELIQRVISTNPHYADAHINLATAFQKRKEYERAIKHYDIAIKLSNNSPEAYNNRGTVLKDLNKLKLAKESFLKAININPQYAEAHNNLGITLKELGELDLALKHYDIASQLQPNDHNVHNNKGVLLASANQFDDAITSYDLSISLNPYYAEVYFNKAITLDSLKKYSESIYCYEQALKVNPQYAEAYFNKAITFQKIKNYNNSIESYQNALAINPKINYLRGAYLFNKLQISDWSSYEEEIARISDQLKQKKIVITPFALIPISDDLTEHLTAAQLFGTSKSLVSSHINPEPISKYQNSEKIRIGYFSADFHDHATMRLMAELFEKHDKQKFELYAYSFGPDSQDQMRQRAIKAFDHFHEVRGLTDLEIAELARKDQIDIAIDLKGYTYDMRVGIFANRAAPIQINYLGYPGTMGADYIDYIVADHTIIPQQYQHLYTEKIIRLPGSYQVNDRSRNISNHPYTRAEVGLPEAGFIFCSFNNNYKITPNIFDVWMRILKAIDSSVLWLLEDNPIASANLKKEAKIRGVAPERLIFAKRLPMAEHLARQKLADLFIDTYPCNAHTTASDALWVGLPLLTIAGETFASRVAASLLQAIEVPELITENMIEYEKKAIQLAQNPIQLSQLKQKLKQKKLETPLFDTTQYTKNLEDALIIVYDHFHSSKLSTSIQTTEIMGSLATQQDSMTNKRFAVTIIQPPDYIHSQAFKEIAETIHYALINLGYDSLLTHETNLKDRQYIILGANLIPHSPVKVDSQSILFNLEQVDPKSIWIDSSYLELLKSHIVWDYSINNIELLKNLGVNNIHHMPIGYVKQLERIPKSVQDIDVLFYGSVNERRLKILNELRESGLVVEQRFGLYGAERDALISRSKIVINIHYYESKILEFVLISYLLADKVCLVSEPGLDPAEL